MPDGLGDVQACIDGLGVQLCRPVVLVDRRGRVLAYSRHTGAVDRLRSDVILSRRFRVPASPGSEWILRLFDPDRASAPVWVPAAPEHGLLPRVLIAVGGHDEPLGYLSVLDADGSLCRSLLDGVRWRIDALGVALRRRYQVDEPAVERDADTVRRLLSGSTPHQGRAAADLYERRRFEQDRPVVALVLAPASTDAVTATERHAALEQCLVSVRRTWPSRRCLHLTRAGHGVLLLGLATNGRESTREVTQLAKRLVVAAGRRLPAATGSAALVGIGGVRPRLDQVAVSYAQARQAVTVAQVTSEHAPIASWDRLGIFRLLVDLPERDMETFAPPALRRLATADDGTLLMTLECYLDHAGHAQAAANALCLHRATLYYRLDRIRQVSGIDLSDGGQRLELHVWLKLLRLRGDHGAYGGVVRHRHDVLLSQTEAG